MSLTDRIFTTHTTVDKAQARHLSHTPTDHDTVEVHPPGSEDMPATLNRFIRSIREPQSNLLGLKNVSPVAGLELRRPSPDSIRVQFVAPTQRLSRKIRNGLAEEVPGVQFRNGVSGLPIAPGDTVGGGALTTGRPDWTPLTTELDRPLLNTVVSGLHQEAMRDARFVIQILFKPVAGRSLKRWWWKRSARQELRYLRGEKVALLSGERAATPKERTQADLIQDKVQTPRFHVTIRILVIGAGEYTRSRLKEVSGAFNVAGSDASGQYLTTVPVTSLRSSPIVKFAEAVAHRRFDRHTLTFQVSQNELAAFVSLPTIDQENIHYS